MAPSQFLELLPCLAPITGLCNVGRSGYVTARQVLGPRPHRRRVIYVNADSDYNDEYVRTYEETSSILSTAKVGYPGSSCAKLAFCPNDRRVPPYTYKPNNKKKIQVQVHLGTPDTCQCQFNVQYLHVINHFTEPILPSRGLA